MPFANFKFPQGLLNEKQKEEIIHKTADMFAGYFVRACAHTRWCLSMKWSMVAGDALMKR
jgi:hypothetical protein